MAFPFQYLPTESYKVVLVVDHDGALIPVCEAIQYTFETAKDWHDAYVHGKPMSSMSFPSPSKVKVRALFGDIPPMLHDGLWIYVLRNDKEIARGPVGDNAFSANDGIFSLSASAYLLPLGAI